MSLTEENHLTGVFPRIGVPSPRNEQRLLGELCAWIDRPPVPDIPMTDAEWEACGNPREMLSGMSGRLSDRALRHFAAACVRRVWHLVRDERAQRAVEAAEQFAAGLIGDADLTLAHAAITNIPPFPTYARGEHGAFAGAWYASVANAWNAAWFGSWNAAEAVADVARGCIIWQQAHDVRESYRQQMETEGIVLKIEFAVQAELLRAACVANPVRTIA